MRRRTELLVAGAFSTAALLAWAGLHLSGEEAPPSQRGPARPASARIERALPEVHTLLEREGSAFHAKLFADEDGVVLVTPTGFATYRADRSVRERAIDLGPVVARQGDGLVFWRSGSLRELSLFGGAERELAAVPRPPRYLLTSERRLAWIHSDPALGTSLQTLSGGHVRAVYESAESISAPVMQAADLYWVATGRDGSWKVGRIELDGGQQTWSAAQHGRAPAMLGVGQDGVYFYAGPQRGVRRLTFDLQRETPVLTGVVCSPFVVSSRVVCAQVGGVFEIPLSGAAPTFLAAERAGPITALATTRSSVFWVAEHGAQRQVVRSVTLADP